MSSLYTIDQMKLVSDWFEGDGYTAEQVNMLGRGGRLRLIKAVLEGRAEIKILAERVTEREKIVSLIHLKPVTSDGRNGHQFIEVMEFNRFDLGKWAKNCMTVGRDAQGNLVVTSDSGQVYKPVVIKGEEFEDDERITSNIRKVVAGMKCLTPPWWLAPLLREAMSDEEIEALGLDWLIVMHEPITDSDGSLLLLGLNRFDAGRGLGAYDGYPTPRWFRRRGFVFLAPQG